MFLAEMLDLGELLEESGAVLHGHFVLTSGRHSNIYFEKFRVLERPEVLTALCTQIANEFRDKVDVVAGPTTGGVIVAFEVARQLRVPALYVESEGGMKKLRRGGRLEPSARVLVVDDVLTTGLSLREVATLIKDNGGVLAGAAVLIDRAEQLPDLGCPMFSAYKVQAQSFRADSVPDWLAQIPIQKPGTRL